MSNGSRNNNHNYSLREDGSFVIKDYNQTTPFSNFLTGIAGVWGVPMWVFYVNRAQGIVSFGIQNKEYSITEFLPANKAYWLTSSVGFRTFLKINEKLKYEPFWVTSQYKRQSSMIIRSESLEIIERNPEVGLEFTVRYYTLPNSPVGALTRVLSIKNISNKKVSIEALDGLPRIIPFGSGDYFLKHMSRTLEAWMHASIFDNLATFRLIVDPADVSETKYIEGANFSYSFYEEEGKVIAPSIIVDPEVVFDHDTSYSSPVEFYKPEFSPPFDQITCGKTPCSFSHFKWELEPGEERSLYSAFGSSFKLDLIKKFVKVFNAEFLREKEEENKKIVEEVKSKPLCVSGMDSFDEYVKSTYLDNVLRGGYPYKFDGGKDIYYIFSRKHGDLERDYNSFELLPSYFSEGEANYRDINQNRRMDLFFNPFIEKKNVFYFSNLIRIDGYNPLVVKGEKLFFSKQGAQDILKEFKIKDSRLLKLMQEGFHLGELFKFLKEEGINVKNREELAARVVECAQREPAASFGEGFWVDHWFYNLDLIEGFFYFYPERVKELFLTKELLFWDDEHRVKERKYRYYLKDGKVYQASGVESAEDKKAAVKKRTKLKNFLRTKNGKLYKATLVEKLLVLILNKSATVDSSGIGIEMEAGKPGWCDSLNGLPALFGSSICETVELKRACQILVKAVEELKKGGIAQITVAAQIASFFEGLDKLLKTYSSSKSKKRDFLWWDKANSVKELFREKVFFCLDGKEKTIKIEKLNQFLKSMIDKLSEGINKAKDKKSGVHYTYFTYDVKKYKVTNNLISPTEFIRKPIPLFLEGPMHVLKVDGGKEKYQALKNTGLFDKELKMFRLNTSLKDQPLEIGRSRIFVPGWLENESVWLHMEYKYLLEILRNGFYDEFFQDFYNCCVCFFDPEKYGRSILENSSFIVSSVYPDKNLWGKGFVARLSGATAELINMWIFLVLGKKPFFLDEKNKLCLKFSPILKGEMFTTKEKRIEFKDREVIIEENCFAFKLFSSTLVVYHNPRRKDTFREDCQVEKIVVESAGQLTTLDTGTIPAPLSQAVREAKIDRIDIYLK
jgi:hypothetical protein